MELIPALLIGVGLLIIYFAVMKDGDKKVAFRLEQNLVIGLILVVIGGYILFSHLSSALLTKKFIGLILTVFGFFMVFKYPYCQQYNSGLEVTGIVFGVIILVVGLVLLIF